jgi:hypothetical protein
MPDWGQLHSSNPPEIGATAVKEEIETRRIVRLRSIYNEITLFEMSQTA